MLQFEKGIRFSSEICKKLRKTDKFKKIGEKMVENSIKAEIYLVLFE